MKESLADRWQGWQAVLLGLLAIVGGFQIVTSLAGPSSGLLALVGCSIAVPYLLVSWHRATESRLKHQAWMAHHSALEASRLEEPAPIHPWLDHEAITKRIREAETGRKGLQEN